MTTTLHDFETPAPELADSVRTRIQHHGLALLATLTADGAPRISGIEPIFHGGHLRLAMMPNSVKGRDLQRDGRLALHNATVDKDVTYGDVKIHGVAVPVGDRGVPGAPDVGPCRSTASPRCCTTPPTSARSPTRASSTTAPISR